MTRSNSEPIYTPEDGANWHRAATSWMDKYNEAADRLEAIDQTLPQCSRCNGTGKVFTTLTVDIGSPLAGRAPCPDCDGTGKASVADLATLWDAVWDNDNVMTIIYGAADAERVIEVDFLRQVRAQRPDSETTP